MPFENRGTFINPEQVQTIYEDVKDTIAPQLIQAIENRDAQGRLLTALEAKLATMQAKKASAENELSGLKVDLDDPLKVGKQHKAQESKIAEIDAAITAIEDAIQTATAYGIQAQADLFDAWMQAQTGYLSNMQEGFDRQHRELSELYVAYGRAIQQLYAEILAQSDFPKFPLRHPRGVAPKPLMPLHLGRENSIFKLDERLEHLLTFGAWQ